VSNVTQPRKPRDNCRNASQKILVGRKLLANVTLTTDYGRLLLFTHSLETALENIVLRFLVLKKKEDVKIP